jgi:hypothetical protein
MAIPTKSHSFKARIYAIGINRCVDVPQKITAVLGGDLHIPVKGKIGGLDYRSTLAPSGNGRHRLFIHSRYWKSLKVDKGDMVTITIQIDRELREVSVPDDIIKSLQANEAALNEFERLTTTDKQRYVDFISQAKQPETRLKRLEQGLERLVERGEKRRKP